MKQLNAVSAETACRSARVVRALAQTRVPVCPPLLTSDGHPVALLAGRDYLVAPWAHGSHVDGAGLSLHEADELGGLVAVIHRELRALTSDTLPTPTGRPRAGAVGPEDADQRAQQLLARVAAVAEPDAFDDRARELLEERRIFIDKYRAQRPAEERLSGPFGWTHGDLQYRNVIRRGGTVAAVLDWDRLSVRPLAEEVARTAQVQFGGERGALDLERVAAFVAGYRAVLPLPRAALAEAVHRLWWRRLTDFWVFEFHYQRGDHGPDHLMVPGEQLLAWWSEHRSAVENAFAAGS